jgi:hypothetical protein
VGCATVPGEVGGLEFGRLWALVGDVQIEITTTTRSQAPGPNSHV